MQRFLRSWPLLLLMLATACSDAPQTPDSGTMDSGPMGPTCEYHAECENGVCFEGQCFGTATCLERSNCASVPVCEGNRCICPEDGPMEKRCVPVCETDNDCPLSGQCLDGICEQYPIAFDGVLPGGNGRGALQVGIGVTPLVYPMGVSMAGYGGRQGKRTPYQASLGGSDSWFDRPDVRTIAFTDGEEMLIYMRLPMGWTTDFMVADAARKVQETTGINVMESIITNATHSHSEPARFHHLVQGLYFGSFGYDEFQFEVFDRLTTSFADSIILALDNLQPAKMGYKVLDQFDPENQIHRDRRGENNGLDSHIGKDDRMVIIRVDDMTDTPIAVFTHFGLHGTHFNGTLITGDAPGGIEVGLTQKLQEKYERPVLGVFAQGNAGDISPAGDDKRHTELGIIQVLGERVWAIVEPELDSISMSATVPIKVTSGRVAMAHDLLYGPGEFYDEGVGCEGAPGYFRYGAFQCANVRSKEDEDPNTMYEDGNLGCVFAVECLTNGYAIPQIQKTRISVAQLGTLGFVTMPGEPLSSFGRSVSARVTEAITDVEVSVTIGYSQDHQFYLMAEDDWLQGGYEPSFGLWGYKQGAYLADHAAKLALELNKEPAERAFDSGNLKPLYWAIPAEEKEWVAFTSAEGEPSDVILDVAETVERLELATFQWRGGHPGLDLPTITLERETAPDTFEPVSFAPNAWTYTDLGFEMLVTYLGECNRRNCEKHTWQVEWEEHRDFPAGRYRLRAEGKAWVDNAETDYTTVSRAFEFVPSTRFRVYDLATAGGEIVGRIAEPPGRAFVIQEDGSRTAETVGHLLRSVEVPEYIGAPLPDGARLNASGRLLGPAGESESISAAVSTNRVEEERREIVGYSAAGEAQLQGQGVWPATRFTLTSTTFATGSAGDWRLELTLTDEHGNAGTTTATITK